MSYTILSNSQSFSKKLSEILQTKKTSDYKTLTAGIEKN